jgi:hypothetical protein
VVHSVPFFRFHQKQKKNMLKNGKVNKLHFEKSMAGEVLIIK